jgi:hypothetical protein
MFKKGWTSMTVAENSGYSLTVTTSEKLEEARAMAAQNRRVSTVEIAQQLNVSQGSPYSVVHDRLWLLKVCARLVLRQLTKEQKHCHVDICYCHLECYYYEGENFLNCIIMGDETKIHHYELKNK